MSENWLLAGKHSKFQQAGAEPAGIAIGLWHGALILIAWFASLYNSDYGIYEPNNDGVFYNTGYVLGASIGIVGTLLFLISILF
jgi:hypothetical protein